MKNHSEGEIYGQINKEISNILFKYLYFYDVLALFVNNLLYIDSKSAFQYFQEFSQIKTKQSFILFLIKKDNNPKIFDLFQFITNEFFDKRNVYAFKFPRNEEEIEKINNFFIKCINYYHEIDNNINDQLNTSNILLCGQCGA